MKVRLSNTALQSYRAAPDFVRQAFDKQSQFLEENFRHPSLHAKKYDEGRNIWQARVSRGWRFYFMIKDDIYIIVDIIPHPK